MALFTSSGRLPHVLDSDVFKELTSSHFGGTPNYGSKVQMVEHIGLFHSSSSAGAPSPLPRGFYLVICRRQNPAIVLSNFDDIFWRPGKQNS
jgi:hypothetical protein